jgi:hypothetical protein
MPDEATGTATRSGGEAGLGWAAGIVPPGISPSAAALLIFAIGLAIWLKGGRHLRVALAASGGVAAATLAWRLIPPAAGGGVEAWAPIALATVGGAAAAAAARRLVATVTLAGVFGLMAPATVIAWDGMAAPLLATPPAATAEPLVPVARVESIARPAASDATDSGGIVGPPAAGAGPLARPEGRLSELLTFGRAVADDAGADVAREVAGLEERAAAAMVDRGLDRLRALAGEFTALVSGELHARFGSRPAPDAASTIASAPAPAIAGDRIPTLGALGVAGIVAGLGLGLARSEFAARAATAAVGAALVILGGLHLPAGLVPGGWIGPTSPEPILVAWIAMSGLGTMLQWSYRAGAADIGR